MQRGVLGSAAACLVTVGLGVLACSSGDDEGAIGNEVDASPAPSASDAQSPGLSVVPVEGGNAGEGTGSIDTSMPILEAAIGDAGVVTFASPLFTDDSEGGDLITGSYGGAQLVLRLPDPPSDGSYGCGAAGAITSMQYGTAANPFTAPQADGGAGCTIDVTGLTGGGIEGTFSGRLYSADGGTFVDVGEGMFVLPFTAILTP